MATAELTITGMTCAQCAATLQKVAEALPGVKARVSYPDATASIETQGKADLADVVAAIRQSGYGAALTGRSGAGLQVAIIGGGSAGFACAIRAVETGAQVTLIESGTLGGTCVNVGCVPSKILIRAAQLVHDQQRPRFRGVGAQQSILDRAALVAQQEDQVAALRQAKYQDILEATPGIRWRRGAARFADPHTLLVTDQDGQEERIRPDRILLAVGARAALPDLPGLAGTPYWTSTEALQTTETPARLIVVGASAVALELGQAFARLGSQVMIVARGRLLARADADVGAGLQAAFTAEGIRVLTDTTVRKVSYGPRGFGLATSHGDIEGDRLLLATGRRPSTEALNLSAAGVKTDARGFIVVNDRLQTNVAHIYAAGDCSTLPQYVYVAAAAGTRAAINMTGGEAPLDLRVLPAVVFTDPQVATVGLTEEAARAAGRAVVSRTLGLENVPRAQANFDTRGFIRLVAEAGSGRLLGAQVLAAEGGEIIETAALAIAGGFTVTALSEQLFPYLTLVEGLKLCAQTFTQDIKRLSCCAG